MKFISTIAALVACASAYQITSPTLNSTITKGSNVNIAFSSVDTDPSTFSVYIVNFQTGHFPPDVRSLAQNVQRSAGSVTVRIPCDLSNDYGYQLNFINGTNTYVIYAQSPRFSLVGNCVDPVAPTVSSAFTNASTSAVQVNVQVIIPNPILWFVQPNAIVAANGAVCPPSVSTVTVNAGSGVVAAVQTVTATVTKTVALACAATNVNAVVPASSANVPSAQVTTGSNLPTVKVVSNGSSKVGNSLIVVALAMGAAAMML